METFIPHPKLTKTIVVMHLDVVTSIIGGLCLITIALLLFFTGFLPDIQINPNDEDAWAGFMALVLFVCIGVVKLIYAGLVEMVIYYLRKGKNWAWIASIILNILNLFSLELPLGIIGLVGLLNQDVSGQYQKRT